MFLKYQAELDLPSYYNHIWYNWRTIEKIDSSISVVPKIK